MYANHGAARFIRIAHGSQETVATISVKDTAKLSRAIAHELGKLFGNITIEEVNVTPDVDHDGADMLRVEIVFSGKLRASDAKNVAGAARKIMPTIDELVDDDDLYTLLSFVSRVDYDRRPKSATY